MFEAKLSQSGQIKKLIEAVKDIVSDANLECNENGISLQAMDSSHVSLVSLIIPSDDFDVFKCEKPITLGLNLNSFYKILKCSSNDDSIFISSSEISDILIIIFESINNDRISEFELKLIKIDTEPLGIPETQYSATISITSSEYRRISSEMITLGDTMQIGISKEGIKFEVEGDIGKATVFLKQMEKEYEGDGVKINISEPVKMGFALRYLNSFSKATPLCEKITLKLCKDFPLQLEFKVIKSGFIRFYLAPKYEE
jgi:proliferating cell nuclear antigen